MPELPRRLNPAQRILVHAAFVYVVIAYVTVLTLVDAYRMARGLLSGPLVNRADDIAIRLVAAGVFFELRGTFRSHLLGKDAAASDRDEVHVSEVCEVFGGYLTVGGLFIELCEGSRSLVQEVRYAEEAAVAAVVVLTLLTMHAASDMVRALWQGRPSCAV